MLHVSVILHTMYLSMLPYSHTHFNDVDAMSVLISAAVYAVGVTK